MTRKDFVLIADALKAAKPLDSATSDEIRGWENSVTEIVHALSTTNPRFDRRRFYAAAGMDY